MLNVGSPERLRATQARIAPAGQMSSLGSTESPGFCRVGSPDDPADVRATTSGTVLRHREVRVVDPSTRAPVPAGCLACGVVQVVAAPDARLGEVAAAFIRLLPGATTTERTLINHCLGRIATFKVPRYIRFVTDWPMSGTKVQKFRLRELIAEELRSAGITEAPRLSSRPAG